MRVRSRNSGTRINTMGRVILVTLCGLILGGMVMFFGIKSIVIGNSDDYAKTTATITDIVFAGFSGADDNAEYDVYVTYTIDGKEYENKLDTYASSYRIGKEIDIYYCIDNPYDIESTGTVMSIVLICIGALILVIVVIVDIRSIAAIKLAKQSRDNREDAYTNQTDDSNNYRFD